MSKRSNTKEEISSKYKKSEITQKLVSTNRKIDLINKKFDTEVTRIEESISRLEDEKVLTQTELNEREKEIFDLQQVKLDEFKQEMSKYEEIMEDIKKKHDDLDGEIQEMTDKETHNKECSGMLKEDLHSGLVALKENDAEMAEWKGNLSKMEKDHPNEFQFVLEEVGINKEISYLREKLANIAKAKKDLERNVKEKKKAIANLKSDIDDDLNMINGIKANLTLDKDDRKIKDLEKFIGKNVCSLIKTEKMKALIDKLYSQAGFELEKELTRRVNDKISMKLVEFKEEFEGIRLADEERIVEFQEKLEKATEANKYDLFSNDK